MTHRAPLGLLGACLVYLVVRALVLATAFDSVCSPEYELALQGNIARNLEEGWRGASLAQYYDNCGGHLVVGILAAPLFALLGPSYLALKLVPLLLGLGALVLSWWIVDAVAGRRAADVGAFLFALAPPTLLEYSLLAKGNHFENLPFQFALLALYLVAWRRGFGTRHLLVLGGAAGFAVFFYFGSLILVGLLFAAHVVARGPRRAALDLRAVLPGFALGLAPLAWVQLAARGRPGEFLGAKLAGETDVLERIAALLRALPGAGLHADVGPIPGRVFGWAFLACFLAAWLRVVVEAFRAGLALVRARRAGEPSPERLRAFGVLLPLAGYPPLVMVANGYGRFQLPGEMAQGAIGYRYLVVHLALACMTLAIGLGLLWSARARAWRLAGRAAAVAALATGATAFALVDAGAGISDAALRYPGYHLPYYRNTALRVARRGDGSDELDAAALEAATRAFDPGEAHEIYLGVGHAMAALALARLEAQGSKVSASELLDAVTGVHGGRHRFALAWGIGSYLRGPWMTRKRPRAVAEVLRQLGECEHPLVPFVVQGFAQPYRFVLASQSRKELVRTMEMEKHVPERLQDAFWQGVGITAGRLAQRGVAADRWVVERTRRLASQEHAAALGRGVELARLGPEELTAWLEALEAEWGLR